MTDTGIRVTKDELHSLVLLRTRLDNCQQMLNFIPKGVDDATMKQYVSALVDKRSETLWLEKDWWDTVTKKYGLTGVNYVSFDDGGIRRKDD
jgi:hypothetical protein